MGQGFAQEREWNVKESIDWHLADDFGHRDVMQCVRNLVGLYKMYLSLHSDSKNPATFEWVNRGDADRNILAYIRRNPWDYNGAVLCILNLSPVSYYDYSAGVPFGGFYKRVFSTYDSLPGQGNPADGIPPLTASWEECDGYSHRVTYSLRPFECIVLEFPT